MCRKFNIPRLILMIICALFILSQEIGIISKAWGYTDEELIKKFKTIPREKWSEEIGYVPADQLTRVATTIKEIGYAKIRLAQETEERNTAIMSRFQEMKKEALNPSLSDDEFNLIAEKIRALEAKMILLQLRAVELVYRLENKKYGALKELPTTPNLVCPEECEDNFYFQYKLEINPPDKFNIVATRCIAGGKTPQGKAAYKIIIDQDGNFSNDPEGNFSESE